MNGIQSVPIDVTDEDMLLQLVAKGTTGDDTERSVEVFLVRKGGGMLIKIDGKPYQRYHVDLQSLCNLVVDAVIPAFLAQEAAEDLKAAPMPDDRCATRADGECTADGPCMHTDTPPVTGEAENATESICEIMHSDLAEMGNQTDMGPIDRAINPAGDAAPADWVADGPQG